ncbi:MAG: aminotransferase class V-fold PLP-dependent enzyme [Oscillospiraceae bacterium]|nr:aminotransferase class V-fold PLP-dependent enzyme [Oscillospiraceae bacterium]
MINFDNAATTFPKPATVRQAVNYAVANYANSGRGGHNLSLAGGHQVFSAREAVALFFNAETENVIFTNSTTTALNFAIKGVGVNHIVMSSMEHNSVSRPIVAQKYSYNTFKCAENGFEYNDETVINNFLKALKPNTNVVAMTAASNVTGRILPFEEIGRICKERNICLILDTAQAAGIIPLDLKEHNINIICAAGHKGLYGLTGNGLLITDGKFPIKSIIQGGTGSSSLDLKQPDFLPDALESGTLNISGVVSVQKGIEFINKKGMKKIFSHENMLCQRFISGLTSKVIIYRSPEVRYVPIVSFNVDGYNSEETAAFLNKNGFALRAGLHCSALAHLSLGTEKGTVRFAPSIFNNAEEVDRLCKVLRRM